MSKENDDLKKKPNDPAPATPPTVVTASENNPELIAHQLKDIEDLAGRVQNIEDKLAEKEKPWYKTVGGITGMTAIIISIVSFVYSYQKDKLADIEANKKEVRENINALTTLESKAMTSANESGKSVEEYVNDDTKQKERFEILLNNIDGICNKVPNLLYNEAYNYIAECYFHYSFRSNKWINYYKAALQVAKDPYDSANTYLAISNSFYTKGFCFNKDSARIYFDLDIKTLHHLNVQWKSYYIAADYSQTAANEAPIDTNLSLQYLDSAETYYKTVGKQYNRDDLKTYIDNQISNIDSNSQLRIDALKQ